MMYLLCLYAISIYACMGIRVDPDTLPSIEVLLVPPKAPFPQIREYLNLIHDRREVSEKRDEESILRSYTNQLNKMRYQIMQMIKPILIPFEKQWREGMYYPVLGSSLLEMNYSANIENLVVHIKPVPMPGNRVKKLITAVDDKRRSDERKQVMQGITEFGQFSQIITTALQRSMKKYFRPNRNIHPINVPTSLLQQSIRKDQNGLNPVLNIRVGSSDMGDGLMDGDSYPSVVGMVTEENEMRTSAQTTLFNELLFYSNQLVLEATNMIKVLLFPPSARMTAAGMTSQTDPLETSLLQIPGVSQAMAKTDKVMPMPPALAMIIRKRAMKNSTVQLDISPPQMDDWSIVDALNALLQSETTLGQARVKAYIMVKRELAKSVKAEIDQLVKTAAITWGLRPDPENLESIMRDG